MKKTICLLPGDFSGPEIMEQGVAVLKDVAAKFGHEFVFETALIGGAAIDATGNPLPDATVEACRKADAVFLAAVGGPKWDNLDPSIRPEKGLLGIRNVPGSQGAQASRLLVFEVTGEGVESGTQVSVSIGQRSQSYDLIVPNSAVRSDSNGSFVLMMTAKSSPLGTRYQATRVDVQVVASDDVNSAVTGAIVAYDYVITNSTAPIEDGMYVRLADNA